MLKYRWMMLLICLLPAAAWANIIAPPLVEMIANPLYSWMAPHFLVLLLLLISLLEVLVLKRFRIAGTFGELFRRLFAINVGSSLLRIFVMDLDAWPLFFVAFALTIPVEALLLWRFTRGLLDLPSFPRALLVSARMNTASYLALTLLLASMLYLPYRGQHDPAVRTAVAGKLIIAPVHQHRFYCYDFRRGQYTDAGDGDGALIYGLLAVALRSSDGNTVRYAGNDGKIIATTLNTLNTSTNVAGTYPPELAPLAMSDDTRVICGYADEKIYLYDRRLHTREYIGPSFRGYPFDGPSVDISSGNRWLAVSVLTDAAGGKPGNWYKATLRNRDDGSERQLGNIRNPRFNHAGDQLAWVEKGTMVIYTIGTGDKRELKVPGADASHPVAWSPDDRYIAYTGLVNPFTSYTGFTDIRVVDLASGRIATICTGIFKHDRACDIYWLP